MTYSCKLKPHQNSGLNRIQTHDLYNTSAALYKLSYQANWEQVTFCVCHIPVDDEDTRERMDIPKIKLWRKDEDMIDHQSFIYLLVSLYLCLQFKYETFRN